MVISFLSQVFCSWMRITPRRGVSVSAESMRILHSVVPRPLAGEMEIHGSSVVATQSPDADTLILWVPPAASALMASLSSPNATFLSASEQLHNAIEQRMTGM